MSDYSSYTVITTDVISTSTNLIGDQIGIDICRWLAANTVGDVVLSSQIGRSHIDMLFELSSDATMFVLRWCGTND